MNLSMTTASIKQDNLVPTKCCPHCGERVGFRVEFNVVCRVGRKEERCYMRTCQVCGGRFITFKKDERRERETDEAPYPR